MTTSLRPEMLVVRTNEPIRGYSWEDLASKIEWEGFDYFFANYVNHDRIVEPSLREKAGAFKSAYEDLYGYLLEKGVVG